MVNNMNTLEYAKNELNKYSFLVFGEFCDIQLVNKSYGNPFDDVIEICVHSGKGVICGLTPHIYSVMHRYNQPAVPVTQLIGA